MTNQKVNDVDIITTISGTDRILVNTDVVNNVLEQIEKDDFVADIISTDNGNLLDIGADNKLAVIDSTITLQGNTFNGNSQLIQTNSSGQYPALDGSLITGITTAPEIPQTTCSTAAATAAKTATLSGVTIADDVHFYVNFTNANTSSTITLNVNSEGAWDIYDLKGNQITGTYFSNADDETVLLKADKTNTRFILVNAPFWESRMGMPSNVYVDLTLGASGSTYTAPADGWIFFDKTATASNQCVSLINESTSLSTTIDSSAATQHLRIFAPIKKGDTFNCHYSTGGDTNYFRFIYSEGSKP